ncbi:hypothetical protein SeSPB_B0081 [Salmonella enterica subsp. enterica serovar Saintpaul str. SARA29]|nr:hypothetical protein SeSPB_B0081 [Salmonella enterica subsp. enterica serovar Saintpaul str. SARA29]
MSQFLDWLFICSLVIDFHFSTQSRSCDSLNLYWKFLHLHLSPHPLNARRRNVFLSNHCAMIAVDGINLE